MGTGRTAGATADTQAVLSAIRARMEERHLSQPDVSRLSGIPQPTISKLLGGHATFTVDHLLALARALEMLPSALLRAAGH